jgi:hypothetical protein
MNVCMYVPMQAGMYVHMYVRVHVPMHVHHTFRRKRVYEKLSVVALPHRRVQCDQGSMLDHNFQLFLATKNLIKFLHN